MIKESRASSFVSHWQGSLQQQQAGTCKLHYIDVCVTYVFNHYRHCQHPHFILMSCVVDNIIKIWRLYPYAQESLAPLMSFYCAHTPIHMTVLRSKLAVAFQEPTSATYSIVMYNLSGKGSIFLCISASGQLAHNLKNSGVREKVWGKLHYRADKNI